MLIYNRQCQLCKFFQILRNRSEWLESPHCCCLSICRHVRALGRCLS